MEKGVKGVVVWAGELVYNLSDQISFTHTGVGEGSLLIPPWHRGGGRWSSPCLGAEEGLRERMGGEREGSRVGFEEGKKEIGKAKKKLKKWSSNREEGQGHPDRVSELPLLYLLWVW